MTTTPKGTRMPADPNHRALLRAVEKLTTQVKRIADTMEPPVVVADDGAQTTSDDTPLPWPTPPYKLCSASSHGALGGTVGPCVLRYLHDGPVHVAADGATFAATGGRIAPWMPTCESGRHYHQHAGETCDSVDAFTERVQDWAQRLAVPDMQHVTATMRENEQLRTERDRVRRLAEQWKHASDRKHGPLRELLQALDGPTQ
ncbi:hypothetical protein [Streptomyces sp. EN23]|uniref:hypothetical protein n=1 Tax=Streptomyces sp. EN23 TaxID=212774 RepID=UPI0008516BD4|nr:hypothetical protein [Streptomyces sp. EN23]